MSLKKRLMVGLKMSFSEKELIPTTSLFLLSTLFFSILRVGLIDEEIASLITGSKYLSLSLVCILIYLLLYLVLSFSKKTIKLINRDDKLFQVH